MKKLLLIAVVAGGLMVAGPRVLMLKFTSVSGSVRAITDITLTGTIIRTGITPDLIIDPITGHTTGTAGIVITAIVIPIITG
jgi:hypothetical protein